MTQLAEVWEVIEVVRIYDPQPRDRRNPVASANRPVTVTLAFWLYANQWFLKSSGHDLEDLDRTSRQRHLCAEPDDLATLLLLQSSACRLKQFPVRVVAFSPSRLLSKVVLL